MENTQAYANSRLSYQIPRRRLIQITGRDGKIISAVLHLPLNQEKPKGLAALIPGWSGDRCGPAELLREIADAAALAGCAALRFDFLSRGDSGGYSGEFGLDMMVANTVDALEAVRPEFPGARIHLAGICSGGNVALGAASLLLNDVSTVAGLSTLPFQEHAGAEMRTARRKKHVITVSSRLLKWSTWKKIFSGGVDYRRALSGFSGKESNAPADGGERNPKRASWNILEKLSGWKGNCLMIYGGLDAEGTAARKIFSSVWPKSLRPIDFHIVPESNHNYYSYESQREAVQKTIAQFISENK